MPISWRQPVVPILTTRLGWSSRLGQVRARTCPQRHRANLSTEIQHLMQYQLTCSCGTTHRVSVSQAGQSLTCACGNSLSIPTLRGLKELPPAQAGDATTSHSSERAETGRPSVWVGILFAIMFLAVPCAIFFAYQRLTMDTSNTEEADRNAAFAELDAATPLMLSDAWNQYSTIALGPPNKPSFYHAEQARRSLEWKIVISSTIALAAAASAAAISVSRRVAREKS
jgi:hypothetical protein